MDDDVGHKSAEQEEPKRLYVGVDDEEHGVKEDEGSNQDCEKNEVGMEGENLQNRSHIDLPSPVLDIDSL